MKKIILFTFVFLSLGIAQADPKEDLYNEIMPEQLRLDYPQETTKSFKVHLLDSDQNFPAFSEITSQNISPFAGVKKYSGKMKYVQIFPKSYKYDVSFENGVYVFKVRVNLKNPTAEDTLFFTELIKQAEMEWNSYRIGMDFAYEFQFNIEPDVNKSHYSVKILDSTRGPYDTNWGRNWDGPTVAHELGHMMGLADEYETLSSKTDCIPDSKMCDQKGFLMKHHYYFILRRLLK